MTTMTQIRLMAVAICLALVIPATAWAATCTGRFPNPITDICWRCVLPISIGDAKIGNIGGQIDIDSNPSSPVCNCGLLVGLTVGFWEPARIVEVVREPYCFPTLGGDKLDPGIPAPEHGRSHPQAGKANRTSLYQAHYYIFNLFAFLGAINDNPCLEPAPFDIAYFTELDPTWADPTLGSLFNFESILFANPVAIAACAVDCVAASTHVPIPQLFWCAGCQGGIYPMGGHNADHIGGVQSSLLLTQRLTAKLHKQLVAWAYHGKAALCGPYFLPVMDNRAYRTQMLAPTPNTRTINGKCCQNFGETSLLWEAGKEFPYAGEDFSYLLFRKRNCCMGKVPAP